MISYGYSVPVPYPDELWYSVVARYHIHSGNLRQITTCRDLFQTTKKDFSVLLPDNDMNRYFELRELDTKNASEKYTLAPFALRFYSEEKKKQALEGNLRYELLGASDHLRYCPECAKEDSEEYGEMYWHRSHQIPYISSCVKHRCKIEESMVPIRYAQFHLCEANENVCTSKEAQPADTIEKLYSQYLDFFLQQPLFKEIPLSQLIACMEEEKLILKNGKNRTCNTAATYDRLVIKFGKELLEQIFPGKSIKTNLRRMLFTNTAINAAQFGLLYAYFEIPETKIFSEKKYKDEKLQKLLSMSQSGLICSKVSVARELGVSVDTLVRLAENTGIEPFWKQVRKGQHAVPQKNLKIYVNDKEKAIIEEKVKASGAASTSEYLKFLLMNSEV